MSEPATKIKTPEQPPAMQASPDRQHHWLQKLVGEWRYEASSTDSPADPR